MAQMPAEQVALALASLNALRAECAVAQPAFDAFLAQTGDLGDVIWGLSLLPHAVVRAAAGTAVVDPGGVNRNLTPIETARIGLMWRIARRIAWVLEGRAWATFLDNDPMVDHHPAVFPPQPPPQLAPQADQLPLALPQRRIKTSLVLVQGDDSEVAPPGEQQARTWAANYFNVKQADPPEERDCTLEQCAVLSQRVAGGKLPYADLTVVGPLGRRAEQQNKSRTWNPTGDGTYMTKEIPDPKSFRRWQADWRVFSTLATKWRLAAEDVNWWAEQATRPAAAGTSRGMRGAPVTAEEQLAARIMPGFETNVATPKRRRRRDDSSASDDFPPASQKKKLQRAAKRQREKSAKQELEAFRQQAKGGGKDCWNKWGVWQQPAKGASKGKYSGLPANTDKMQRTDVDGKTEICRMWNKSTTRAKGECAGVAVCPMGRAHKCWFCLSTAHTGTEGGCL